MPETEISLEEEAKYRRAPVLPEPNQTVHVDGVRGAVRQVVEGLNNAVDTYLKGAKPLIETRDGYKDETKDRFKTEIAKKKDIDFYTKGKNPLIPTKQDQK